MDHMNRKTVRLDHLKMVVLDEADEMLNMGFLETLRLSWRLPGTAADHDVLRHHEG